MSTDDAEEKPYIPRKESRIPYIETLSDKDIFWQTDRELRAEYKELKHQLKVGDLQYYDYLKLQGLLTQEAMAMMKKAKELGIPGYEIVRERYNEQQ